MREDVHEVELRKEYEKAIGLGGPMERIYTDQPKVTNPAKKRHRVVMEIEVLNAEGASPPLPGGFVITVGLSNLEFFGEDPPPGDVAAVEYLQNAIGDEPSAWAEARELLPQFRVVSVDYEPIGGTDVC